RFRLFEAVGVHSNVSRQMPGDGLGRAALAGADAITDGAAALKASALPQAAQVRLPGVVISIAVVVHQKDVVGHGGLRMWLMRRLRVFRAASAWARRSRQVLLRDKCFVENRLPSADGVCRRPSGFGFFSRRCLENRIWPRMFPR